MFFNVQMSCCCLTRHWCAGFSVWAYTVVVYCCALCGLIMIMKTSIIIQTCSRPLGYCVWIITVPMRYGYCHLRVWYLYLPGYPL
jgi:hypothetical protein